MALSSLFCADVPLRSSSSSRVYLPWEKYTCVYKSTNTKIQY